MVTTATDLNVAVIGVGGWGKNHARVLRDLGALAAICDVNIQRSRELAKMYDAKPYDSVDRMLQEERKLDACIVCTSYHVTFYYRKKNNGEGN